MYTTKIINVETAYSQADKNHFIDVEVEVYKGEEKLENRRFGYPLGTEAKVIKAELAKYCETLASDAEVAERSAELDRQLTAAQSLKDELMPSAKKEAAPTE